MIRHPEIKPATELDQPARSLLEAAAGASRHAYSPYSGIAVGAALLTAGGRIHAGANVENGSYGLTVCAERTALFGAVAKNDRVFTLLAVASPHLEHLVPCGACLQCMAEFCPDLRILLQPRSGGVYETLLSRLLPVVFSAGPRSRLEGSK
ncbi:MAG: cytidine deaminase [Chitinivibrionia bacterium]|nr:cytidine deaminase [Chitinivibrionia bacterium]